jgi:predicted RNA-binding protein with EMAP domain
MGKIIYAPISVGELIDKISILDIKLIMISDEDKIKMVKLELLELMDVAESFFKNDEVMNLYKSLYLVNTDLWNVEDVLRKMEADKKFDEEFIEKARSVYFLNDKRFKLKSEINSVMGSEINEVKQYINYQ